MITCPQCGAQNLPGLAYCENCGSPLPQQAAAPAAPAGASPAPAPTAPTAGPSVADAAASVAPAPAPDPVAAAIPQPVMPVDQPPPAPDMNIPTPTAAGDNVVTADSEAPATAAAAAPTQAPAPPVEAPPPAAGLPAQATPAPAAAPGAAAALTLTFPSGQAFTMDGEEANVGRADVAQNWHPELDVIPYGGGAPDLGVSRHQARLARQDGGFVVVDMGSTNGTYVNGRAAPYNQSVELHDGDTLSFGALNTQVSIK